MRGKQLVISRLGYSFYEDWLYAKHYGKFEENGKASESHTKHKMENKDGVLIPDDPVRKIKF